MWKKIRLIVCLVISVIMLNGCSSLPYETTTYVSTPTYYYYKRTPQIPYYFYTPKVTYVYKYHYVKPKDNMPNKQIKPNSRGVNRRPNNRKRRKS